MPSTSGVQGGAIEESDQLVQRKQDTVARLKAARAPQRGKVTNLMKDLKKLYDAEAPDLDDLAYCIELLERAISTLDTTESELEQLGEFSRMDQYFTDSDQLLFKARRRLSRLEKAEEAATASSVSYPQQIASLPTLPLPKFSGGFMQWISFWEQFKAAVHNRDIPPIQKFVFLKNSLEGDAKDALAEFAVSAENYRAAVAELEGRYGNPSVLIGMYSAALLELPECKPDDLASFRSVVDKFKSYLRELRSTIDQLSTSNLASSARDHEVSNLILTPILLRKLPADVVLEWNRRTRSNQQDRFDLEKLLEFVKGELEEREALGVKKPYTKHEDRKQNQNKTYRATVNTVRADDTSDGGCPPKMDSYAEIRNLPVGSRRDFVTKKRLCFNCLRPKHSVSECRSEKRCMKCGKKHHTLLHDEPYAPTQQPQNVTQNTKSSYSSEPEMSGCNFTSFGGIALSNVPHPSPGPRLDMSSPESSDKTLVHKAVMQTALLLVSNENAPEKRTWARALLDPGSEETYISSRLSQKLGLATVGRQTFSVETFGCNRSVSVTHKRVGLIFQSRHEDKRYRLFGWEVERTCNVFRSQNFGDSDREFFSKFQIADSLEDGGVCPVDILLGADSLPRILLPKAPVLSPSGLLLTPTILGWTIMGMHQFRGSRGHSLATFTRCYRIATANDIWSF